MTNAIIGNALTALQASQLGMRTASNNVANVNTPGYARTELSLAARNIGGQGMGVEVVGIRRIADAFLQSASMRATSDSGRFDAVSGTLDRLQAQFGSTDDAGSLFGRLTQAFSSISTAALDPAERVARLSALSDLQSFFDESRRLSTEIRRMRDEADQRISAGVGRVNEILTELEGLNGEARASGGVTDISGVQNRQSELLDELSRYIDVRGEVQSDGRLFLRTENGVGLLDNSRVTLAYVPAGSGAYGVEYGQITATVSSSGAQIDIGANIRSGEIRGLMDLRDVELPALAAELAEFTSGTADALNAAHNNASAYPAPNVLEGRNTGLLSTDLLTGTGQATLAVVNADGTLVDQVQLAFAAGGFTVDGVAGSSVSDLVTQINAAFGGTAIATFTNGQLTLTASNPAHGVATVQDEASPSSLGGRGFAHFFGLNDIIDSNRPVIFDTALLGTSPHGLAPGGVVSFAVNAADGRRVADISVPVTGTTLNDMLTALNSAAGGVGQYGSFALDGAGRLGFTPASGYSSFKVALTGDSTVRGSTGLAFSQLFGLGDAARLSRAEGLNVSSALRADTGLLSLSQLDISGASLAGDLVLTEGDGRGGRALQTAITTRRGFDTAGDISGGQISLQDYASRLAGDVGSRAARAERASLSASSVKVAADQKRADVEGVNLDEELARMTQFQQSYNAAARLLQAAKEMTDTLLSIV